MQNRIISIGIVAGSIVVTYQDGSTEILGPVGGLDPEELQEAVRKNSGDIAGVKRDIADLKADFDDLDDRVSDLEAGGTGGGGGSAAPMESITWAELKAKRDGGTLTPGMQYRITDYLCTTTQAESRAVSHPYDIIVAADKVNVLNENARACLHDGDDYYTADGHSANLKAWELKYCLDNDTSRFAWADETNGKGVVYYLKDEKDNECPYDFKQIQFKRYKITECKNVPSLVGKYTVGASGVITGIDVDNPIWAYTFNYHGKNIEDATVLGLHHGDKGRGKVLGNKIAIAYDGDRMALNNIVFLGSNDCTYNTFGANSTGNTFGDNCNANTFDNYCSNNTFGNICYEITFGGKCTGNTFGDICYEITFGGNCTSNTFCYNCYGNTFGDSCYGNTFGDSCYGNTFGDSCYGNTFGDNCSNNTFGDNCYEITFGGNCTSNTFGHNCYGNTFGDNCNANTFDNYCSNNTFGDICSSNVLECNCSYIKGMYDETTGAIAQLYHVLSGTAGSYEKLYELPTKPDSDLSVTYVGYNSSGNIVTWTPADSVTVGI